MHKSPAVAVPGRARRQGDHGSALDNENDHAHDHDSSLAPLSTTRLGRAREFLPFVPEEEQRVYERLHAVLHAELLPLRRSHGALAYSLQSLEPVRQRVDELARELAAVRREFKRALERSSAVESSPALSSPVSLSVSPPASPASNDVHGRPSSRLRGSHQSLMLTPTDAVGGGCAVV